MPRTSIRLFTIVVTAVLVAGAATVDAGAAVPAGRPFPVATAMVDLVDTTRPTAARGPQPELPSRTLSTLLVYPDSPGRYPLMVFSHGFTASGPAYRFLLERWAAYGFVIAAPTFPLTNRQAPGGPFIGDYVNQPEDVSFVIDSLLRLAGDPASAVFGRIDVEHVVAAGHSLGAITTLGAAYNTAVRDERIDAAIPISGVELPFGAGTFDYSGGPPLLLIHGTLDRTVPYASSQAAYGHAVAPKYLLTLLDAPHTPFVGAYLPVIDAAVVGFLDAHLGRDPAALRRLRVDANVPGLARLDLEVLRTPWRFGRAA